MRCIRYDHTVSQYEIPDAGSLIVAAHKIYRVVEVKWVDEVDWTDAEREIVRRFKPQYQRLHWPAHIVLRPIEHDSDDVRARDHDKHYRVQMGHRTGVFNVYKDEHYPLCSKCGEPTPCREMLAREEAEKAVEHMSRYEDPNVCPYCGEGFKPRQRTHRFEENLEIPGGPPVTFHLRGNCFNGAYEYERRLVKTHPGRVPVLYCTGWITTHNDDTYECSAGDRCPGSNSPHEGYHSCSCVPCNVNGPFHCRPSAQATRRTT